MSARKQQFLVAALDRSFLRQGFRVSIIFPVVNSPQITIPFFRFVNVKKDINCTIPESGLKNSRWRGYSSHDSQKKAIFSPGNASAKTLPPAETMPRSPFFQRPAGRNVHIDDLCHAFRAHMSGLFIAFREIHQLKLQSAQCKPCHLKKPSNHHDTKLPQIPYILRHSYSFQFKSIQESSQICSEISFS